MTNNDIRILLNTIAKTEREGLVSYNKLTQLLEAEGNNHFDYNLRKWEIDWKARKTLEPFLVEVTDLTSSGSFPFSNLSGTIAQVIEARSTDDNPIEIIDNTGIWYERLKDSIKKPSQKYPIMRLKNQSIEILPLSITLKDIIYYKYPTAPYLDGYLDENLKFNYLAEGGSVDLDSCSSCVTLDGTTTGTYNSQTAELEFYDVDKIEIASRILFTLGIKHDKQELYNYMQITDE